MHPLCLCFASPCFSFSAKYGLADGDDDDANWMQMNKKVFPTCALVIVDALCSL